MTLFSLYFMLNKNSNLIQCLTWKGERFNSFSGGSKCLFLWSSHLLHILNSIKHWNHSWPIMWGNLDLVHNNTCNFLKDVLFESYCHELFVVLNSIKSIVPFMCCVVKFWSHWDNPYCGWIFNLFAFLQCFRPR